mgnify:CR=1 FL=1
MSIRNYIKGDDNQTLLMFCNHFNCGEVDIRNDIIKNVKKMYIVDIQSNNIMIDNIDVKKHLMNLNNKVPYIQNKLNVIKDNKIPYLENKVIELQNQIIELQKVINELTNINLIN